MSLKHSLKCGSIVPTSKILETSGRYKIDMGFGRIALQWRLSWGETPALVEILLN